MSTYTDTIPAANHLPSQDQPLMLDNFGYLKTFGNKDHNFSSLSTNTNDGYHRQVTFNTNHTTTGFASGVSVLYANTANGGSQMFFNNALGDIQLTSVKASVPTNAAQGASFLPGGLLIQWGQNNAVSGVSGTPINFLVPFSASPYSVTVTQNYTAGIVNMVFVDFATLSTTSFTPFLITPGGSNYTGGARLFWIAIGPA